MRLRRGAPASTATGVVIAVAGVALALMVMELSLSVASGFKHEIERKVLGFDAPVSVLPAYDYYTGTSEPEMVLTDTLCRIIADAAGPERRIVPTFRRHAILKTDNDFMAVECLSRDVSHDSGFEQSNMVSGVWPGFADDADADSIVISETMAVKLGVNTDEKIFMYFFVDDMPKARRAVIAGLYRSNFGEYDNSVVFAPLSMMRRLGTAGPGSATSVAVENVTKDEINPLSEKIQEALVDAYRTGEVGKIYTVTNIFNSGAVFFSWLELLDTNVVVIFILMICVAAFTLISSLFIIILDRMSTIGLLRALGASKRCVSNTFVFVALRLVGLGMLIGNVLGIGVILLQRATHFLPLDPQMYYLAYVPFELNWLTLALLNIGTAAGAWLILILPAKMASRIEPARTMRYE